MFSRLPDIPALSIHLKEVKLSTLFGRQCSLTQSVHREIHFSGSEIFNHFLFIQIRFIFESSNEG